MAMRTAHRDPRSLKSYQNLRGGEGQKQQRDILGSDGEVVVGTNTMSKAPTSSAITTSDQVPSLIQRMDVSAQPGQHVSTDHQQTPPTGFPASTSVPGLTGVNHVHGGTVNVNITYNNFHGPPGSGH